MEHILDKLKIWKSELKKITPDIGIRTSSNSDHIEAPYLVGYNEKCDISFRISYCSKGRVLNEGFRFHMERRGNTEINNYVDIDKSNTTFIVYKKILKDIIEFESSISTIMREFPNIPKKYERDILISELIKEVRKESM